MAWRDRPSPPASPKQPPRKSPGNPCERHCQVSRHCELPRVVRSFAPLATRPRRCSHVVVTCWHGGEARGQGARVWAGRVAAPCGRFWGWGGGPYGAPMDGAATAMTPCAGSSGGRVHELWLVRAGRCAGVTCHLTRCGVYAWVHARPRSVCGGGGRWP